MSGNEYGSKNSFVGEVRKSARWGRKRESIGPEINGITVKKLSVLTVSVASFLACILTLSTHTF